MKLNGIKLQSIPKDKVHPIYVENFSPSKINKLMLSLKEQGSHCNHIVVERDVEEDRYWLIEGYAEYATYQLAYGSSDIPCIVQSFSNKTAQRIKLLKRIFHEEQTKWLDKHFLMDQYIHQGKSIDHIARQLDVDKEDIQSYIIHPSIPSDIKEQAIKSDGIFITLEQIRRLEINPLLKRRLYERAVHKKRNETDLTQDKLEKLKWLVTLETFKVLKKDQQWELVLKALNYKETLEIYWKREIEVLRDKHSDIVQPLF